MEELIKMLETKRNWLLANKETVEKQFHPLIKQELKAIAQRIEVAEKIQSHEEFIINE